MGESATLRGKLKDRITYKRMGIKFVIGSIPGGFRSPKVAFTYK